MRVDPHQWSTLVDYWRMEDTRLRDRMEKLLSMKQVLDLIKLSDCSTCEFLGKDNSSTLTTTVKFIDLAGSERASQSLSTGTRLKEGCHISRSQLTLGTVMRKLSKGKNGHIPFRDSKLTWILQFSWGKFQNSHHLHNEPCMKSS